MNELTWNHFLDICKKAKTNTFAPPDWDKVETEIAATLNVSIRKTITSLY